MTIPLLLSVLPRTVMCCGTRLILTEFKEGLYRTWYKYSPEFDIGFDNLLEIRIPKNVNFTGEGNEWQATLRLRHTCLAIASEPNLGKVVEVLESKVRAALNFEHSLLSWIGDQKALKLFEDSSQQLECLEKGVEQ